MNNVYEEDDFLNDDPFEDRAIYLAKTNEITEALYNFQTLKREHKMKYSEILAIELEKALIKENKILEKYGEEPELNGTIIKWEAQYRVNGVWYSFAAIKAGGYWYKTTGVHQPKYKYTWEELVDWLEGLIQVRKFKVVYTPKSK